VQLGGEQTMTVVWNTDQKADGRVAYGRDAELGSVQEQTGSRSRVHVVTLDGLRADRTYHYRISSDGEVLASGLRFRTFPRDDSEPDFTLLAWGDSGDGSSTQMLMAEAIDDLVSSVDVALHLGDVVYQAGEPENFNPHYFDPYRNLVARVPVYLAIGNHEYVTDDGQPYLDAFYLPANNPEATERYYSFDYGPVHIACVDTNTGFGQSFAPGSAQHAWLRRDLRDSEAQWKIVAHHHSPYTAGEDHVDDAQNELIREHLGPLYDDFGVDLVLSAHSHAFERTYPIRNAEVVRRDSGPDYDDLGGVIYVTSGGGGRKLDQQASEHPNSAFQVVFRREFHVTLVEFSGDSLKVRAVDDRGRTLEEFSLRKRTAGQPPEAVCEDVRVDAGADCVAALSPDDVGGASFDPDGGPVHLRLDPEGPFEPGRHDVTLTVIDGDDESDECAATVRVEDDEAPEIDCPGNLRFDVDEDCSFVLTTELEPPEVADNCTARKRIELTHDAPDQLPLGDTQVTWSAVDEAGNAATCEQRIRIVDRTPPRLECPADLEVACRDERGAKVEYEPTARDNCGDEIEVVCSPPSGQRLSPGEHEVTCTATDGADRTSTCTFRVTVRCGGVVPGDCDGNGRIQVTDALCFLGALFLGEDGQVPCGGGLGTESNQILLDWSGDNELELSDAILLLNWLFASGPAHTLGAECTAIGACPDICERRA